MRLAGVGFSLSEFVHYAGITGQGYFVREYFGNRTRKFFTVLFLPILMMTPQVIEKSALAKEKKERKILERRLSLTIFLLSTILAVDYVLGVDHTWS